MIGWFGDFLQFLAFNLRHYNLALWGLRQQLEPDYPVVERFFPSLIRDSVYEWRSYGAMILWAAFIASLPGIVPYLLIGLWVKWSWERAGYFRSNFIFWRQAYRECPDKKRVQIQYFQWIIRETEQRMKAGANSFDTAPLDREALQLQDRICQNSGSAQRTG